MKRLGRSAALHRFPGRYPGTVVDDKDPDQEGKLRIRVDQVYGKAADDEKIADDALPWARPSVPCSGAQSGEFHIPPIGACVWVAFWGGSFEHPIWVGGWWSADDMPAAATSSYENGPKTRLVRTVNGHAFEMRWKEGESRIELKTEDGLELLLDVTGKKVSLISAKAKVELDDNASKVTVQSQGDVQVTAQGDVKVNATGNVNVTGAATSINVTGDATIVASKLEVTASPINLKGTTAVGAGPPKFALMDVRMIPLYAAHTHTTTVAGAPTGPPITGVITPGIANTLDLTSS